MHEAEVGVRLGDDAREVALATQRRHVIHHLGAESERPSRHLRLRGVDGEGLTAERREHRLDAAQLLLERDAVRARPRRLAADVDDRSARVEHPARLDRGDVGPQVETVAAERVGRDVDDAHHGRTGKAVLYRRARASHGAILRLRDESAVRELFGTLEAARADGRAACGRAS